MRVFEIPLSGKNQTLGIALIGVTYRLTVQWRNAFSTWFLDIADTNGNPLLQGLALVSGCDLLQEHQELGIGGTLVMLCDAGVAAPAFDNLGTSAHLLFVVP